MLPLLGYFLAAVMVITGLFPYAEWQMYVFISSVLLLSMVYRHCAARITRAMWMTILVLCVTLNVSVWALWAEIPWLAHFQLLLILMLLLSGAWYARIGFLNIVALIFPVIAMVHQWGHPFIGGHEHAGVELLIWSLACWPCIALMAQGRLWMVSSLFAVCTLLSIVIHICSIGSLPHYKIWEIVRVFYMYSSIELTIVQCVLVVVSVAPLLMSSAGVWRWTAICAVLCIAGPLIVVLLCGPWYDGWPLLLWYVLWPALAASAIAVLGMLCTVRRPELLYETSVRALALGIGASAVLLLPLIDHIPDDQDLIILLASALAPCLWSIVLAIIIMTSGLIARQSEAHFVSTGTWEKSRSRVVVHTQLRVLSFAKDVYQDIKKESAQWVNPSSFVPFLLFLSTWPVLQILSEHAWVSFVCVCVSFICAKILPHSLLLWAILSTALVYLSAVCLGMHWLIAFSCAGPVLFVLWLFVRWPALNVAWAYVSCLLVLCIVHVPVLMSQGGDPIPVLLLCAMLVLFCNGVQDGAARWFCLPLMSLTLMTYLSWWVYRSDPFAMIAVSYQNEWENVWLVLCRTPILLCIFYALMISRQRAGDASSSSAVRSLWFARSYAQKVLLFVALILVVAWCLSWRPTIWQSAIVTVLLLWNAPSMYVYLRDCSRDHIRWPLLDALTLTLAAMIITAGECYGYYLMHQRDTGTVSAGALGVFVYAVKQDALACITSVVLVFVAMRLDLIRRLMQRFIHILLFYKRWKRSDTQVDMQA